MLAVIFEASAHLERDRRRWPIFFEFLCQPFQLERAILLGLLFSYVAVDFEAELVKLLLFLLFHVFIEAELRHRLLQLFDILQQVLRFFLFLVRWNQQIVVKADGS